MSDMFYITLRIVPRDYGHAAMRPSQAQEKVLECLASTARRIVKGPIGSAQFAAHEAIMRGSSCEVPACAG